jgi:predicted RecB family nuclease
MSGKVTGDVLESYLNCKLKASLKLAGERGEKHDYELLQVESRDRVCRAATERLLARHPGHEAPQGMPLTAELLGRGLPLLLDVTFEDEDLSISFDALLRVDDKSRPGGFHYAPVLFHEAEKPSPNLRLLLAVQGLLLAGVQGEGPAGGVLFHGSPCRERRVKLAFVAKEARRLLREAREARAGPPPRLLLNDHCQVCEFRKRCHAEATAKDHLSLLRGMGQKEISKYSKRGIFTVTQLSYAFRARRRMRPGQRGQAHQHALQALAIREKKVYVLGTPELPVSLPRVYFDIEGDPGRGFDYLLGLLVVAGGAEQRHSFWADGPAEEARIFNELLDIVAGLPDAWLYTYGSYEAAFLRRVGKAAGREEEAGRVLARTCNVLSVVHGHFYFPVHANGLKDVARHLGFAWTEPDASGLQSVVWRRRWEDTGSAALKGKLTTYNLEDCAALRKVTEFLYAACPGQPAAGGAASHEGHEVSRVEETTRGRMHGWIQSIYGVPDFGYIHDRASFDYLRDRVYVRTSKAPARNRPGKRVKRWKKNRRVNREVEITAQACPFCGGTELARRQNRSLARLAFDLRITRGGIKSWVTRYRAAWHHCAGCGGRFLPGDYLRLEEFCHSLKSWAMYEYVAHRASLPSIADTLRECFNMPIDHVQVYAFKQLLARYYEGTYQRLLQKIVAGHLAHADETEIHVRRVGQAYVWVFTNLEEVVFLYRPSREGDFLHQLLKDFRGVLVSDFYAAYDSLKCEQQKCLIHLLRDFNQDILANPWDQELKSLASDFGRLLRAVVTTIDRHGLKRKHLGEHKRDVARFFGGIAETAFRSEAAEGYRQRLLRCRGKLFTFLDHDGVPWHNNPAEHAVKAIVYYREAAGSLVTEAGLKSYLVLLSIQQTCKYKGVSFLKFLLSRETDIDVFCQGHKRKAVPAIELCPEGTESYRPRRKRLGAAPAADGVNAGGAQALGGEGDLSES